MSKTENSRRQELYNLLGELPDRNRPITARKIGEEDRGAYMLEKLVLDLNGIEDVPAFFIRPREARGRLPAILYNHAHGGNYALGKRELLEGHGNFLQKPPYAEQLAALGCCALCIDTWAFGERSGRRESEIFKEMLWNGRVMWGMMVYDNLRALDYLISRPEVDRQRLGTLGLSMGSTMAWWTAALDERLKVCVDICCMSDFQAMIETRGLDAHGIYYYVPSLLRHFTTARINALIAPRPHLCLCGTEDPLTPPAGLDRIDQALREVYAREGAADAWRMSRSNTGHLETPAMRAEIVAFLKRWL